MSRPRPATGLLCSWCCIRDPNQSFAPQVDAVFRVMLSRDAPSALRLPVANTSAGEIRLLLGDVCK